MEDFDGIFRAYYSAVYGFLLKLSGFDCDLAQDLAQETFFEAYLAISDFKGGCELRTWLIGIAKNRFYMALRRQKREAVRELAELPTGDITTVEDELYRRELLRRSRSVIDGMQPKMREVMLYRIYSDLPYAQICATMGISESSAKTLFHRGKSLLQKRLREDYGYEI